MNAIILHVVLTYIHPDVGGKLSRSEKVMRGPFVEITWNDPITNPPKIYDVHGNEKQTILF